MRHAMTIAWRFGIVAVTTLLACGGTPATTGGVSDTPDGSSTAPQDAGPNGDTGSTGDGGGPSDDTGAEGGTVAPRSSACTPLSQQKGTAVNTSHGRLDGTLVYVLAVDGSSACNGDNSHVHLQVEVNGAVYDIAVDIGTTGDEVGFYEDTMTVPGGVWAEGWHGTDALTYSSLGVTSTELPLASPDAVAAAIESHLADTSKISIFCTGYSQDNGCHDVHYESGNGKDGAIVLDPTAATSPMLFFRFSGETF